MKLKNIPIWGTVFEGKIFPVAAKDKVHNSAGDASRPYLAHDEMTGDLLGMARQTTEELKSCGGIHPIGGCPCMAAQQVSMALTTNLLRRQQR